MKTFTINEDYLDAAIEGIAFKVKRIALERELAEVKRNETPTKSRIGKRGQPTQGEELERQVLEAFAAEQSFECELQERLALSRQKGFVPAHLKLADDYSLDEVQALTLLVGFVPCLGEEVTNRVLGDIHPFLVTTPSIEMVMMLSEVSTTKDRLAVMEALHGATTPLVLHGLVTLETTHAELRPAERPMTFFHLTQNGYDALLAR